MGRLPPKAPEFELRRLAPSRAPRQGRTIGAVTPNRVPPPRRGGGPVGRRVASRLRTGSPIKLGFAAADSQDCADAREDVAAVTPRVANRLAAERALFG